mmetsp:Transcript_75283/g.174532  ORF Transcript_75283/g.174532 Transcript_75283/m.174532 type:complete len:85 (-) Transcript_75283:157-411(-)
MAGTSDRPPEELAARSALRSFQRGVERQLASGRNEEGLSVHDGRTWCGCARPTATDCSLASEEPVGALARALPGILKSRMRHLC